MLLRTTLLTLAALMAGPLPRLQAAKELSITGDLDKSFYGRPIKIVSQDPALQQLLTTAFATHGSFDVRGSNPDLILEATPAGGGVSVKLTIGRAPATRTLSWNATAATAAQAALLGADKAVEEVTKSPGYFSGKIIFISGSKTASNLFYGDLFGQSVRQVTTDNAFALSPCFSPDGNSVLYTTYFKTGYPDIYRLTLATGSRSPFATFKGTNTGADFSPDGSRVAMVLSGTGNPELYVADASGKNLKRLTVTKGLESAPDFSPDGSTIVFSSTEQGGQLQGGPQLYTMAASGGPMKRIPTNISGNCTEPVYNPRDGKILAFTAMIGGNFQICLYDNGHVVQLTTGSGDSVEPNWLNDGRHLLYTQQRGPARRLAILDSGVIFANGAASHKPQTSGSARATTLPFISGWQADFHYPAK